MAAQRKIPTPTIIGVAGLAALAVAALGYVEFGGWNADAAGAGARYTARFSFPIFMLAWSASALATLWPGGWRAVLLRRRRAIGLSFAAAHLVHFAALLIVVLVFGVAPSDRTLYGGGAAYVLVAAMALTSNNWSIRTLGQRNWKTLHTIGGLAIAIVFTVSYLGRLETKPWLGVPALALIGVAVALKALAWMKKRAPRAA